MPVSLGVSNQMEVETVGEASDLADRRTNLWPALTVRRCVADNAQGRSSEAAGSASRRMTTTRQ